MFYSSPLVVVTAHCSHSMILFGNLSPWYDVKNNGGDPLLNIKESVEGSIQKGTLGKNPPPIFLSYCKQKYNNKKYLLILCCFHSKDYPRS